jgi:hypothetical protein
MPSVAGYTGGELLFVLLAAAAATTTWYLTEPVATRVASAVAAGLVVSLVLLVVFRLDSERLKGALLDLLSLWP